MLITIPGDVDVHVRPGVLAAEILAAAGLERGWCGPTPLDPDHPVGLPPLIEAARITSGPGPSCAPVRTPHLRVLEGPDAGAVVSLATTVVVGRDMACELSVNDPAVSSEHAVVTTTYGRNATDVRIRDLRSANGTVIATDTAVTTDVAVTPDVADAQGRGGFKGVAVPSGAAMSRGRRLRAGETFAVGHTLVGVETLETDDQATASPAPPLKWSALATGAASGIALAAMTGRWALALVGLVPAALPWLANLRRKGEQAAPRWDAPAGPLAVRGDPDDVAGYVRAVLVNRARGPFEERWREPWTRWLDVPRAGDEIIHVAPGAEWPSWSATRVDVTPTGRVEDDGHLARHLGPLAMTASTADLAARRIAGDAPADGLPASVRWGDLEKIADGAPGSARSLRVALGSSADGTYTLDLDADGPHVLVAGTTGAGKSVALETIVAALAYAHSPSDLNLALIDFKGGAGLRACMGLPHVSARLTDLDGSLASRAIEGLSHELASRKADLSSQGLSSLSEWERRGGAPPRLLVVIDEYQEITARHSSFLPDLARIAAQGRSLGLHLILATQRPAGAVTPEVRANVSSTIALRVASDAESRDLIGTPEASTLPSSAPGRAVIAKGTSLTPIQIAAPDAAPSPGVTRIDQGPLPGKPLAVEATSRWEGHDNAPPLWRDPLPTRWDTASHPLGLETADTPRDHASIAIGLVDRPLDRTQHVAHWDPSSGPAVIVGPPRSGRTGALRAIAEQGAQVGLSAVWLPTDPRLASRTLHLAASRPDVLLLVDNLESALAMLATVDDGDAVEDLLRRPALRLPTAIAAGPGASVRLASSAAVIAVLSGLEPNTAQQWGAPRTAFTDTAPAHPGRAVMRLDGVWDNTQLAFSRHQSGDLLVSPLPTTSGDHASQVPAPGPLESASAPPTPTEDVWGYGGDEATMVTAPTGLVTLVGPPGPAHDAVAHSLSNAEITSVELAALVPNSATAVIACEPTPRVLRALAPHEWRGLCDPAPVPGRVVLIHGGRAITVQLRPVHLNR